MYARPYRSRRHWPAHRAGPNAPGPWPSSAFTGPTASGATRPVRSPNPASATSETALFEDDNLIPVCLGGENASPLNHCRSRAALRLVKTGLDLCYLPIILTLIWLQTQEGAPVRPWL